MKKVAALLICVFGLMTVCYSQTEFGPEVQHTFGKGASDNMFGLRYEGFRARNSWNIGLSYNFSSKKSYSQSKGIGFYIGYRRGFSYNNSGNGNAFLGFRSTFLFDSFMGKEKSKGSFIMPTFEGGYQFLFGNHVYATPAAGYGYKIKLNKEFNSLQEDEGGRFIPGISIGARF
ncbi:MAG: hypothetical protein JST10_02355 [Bacteroidetes bacterium]|nr:hypothetical protein [Bacteroidota bacterium]MBS1631393.1 hypothetical protein [Bacteroidota bacterium]